MLIEGRQKFFSPQNSVGVSQEKVVAVISQIVQVNADQFSNANRTKTKKQNKTK